MYLPARPDWQFHCRPASFLKLLVAMLACAVPVLPALAQDIGNFTIQSASVNETGGVYFLDAQMDLRLSTDARQALRSGVPLTIRLDVELLHHRRFWADSEEAVLKQRYQLEYHALAERYVVLSLNSGDQTTFATLRSAMGWLGTITDLPLIDKTLVQEDKESYFRLRVVLDADRLPGPLRLLAFWRHDWSIESDWYRCPLPAP